MYKVDAVIVTYNPDINFLSKTIKSLRNQVRKIYIIDNTPKGCRFLSDFMDDKVEVIMLYENKGIAYAQNVGIKESLKNNSDFILLSDQDTIYPDSYIEKLLNKSLIQSQIESIAAIVPVFFETNKNKKESIIVDIGYIGFKKKSVDRGFHEVALAIASGMVLNVHNLKNIGLFREDFFIDAVDTEWCLRARNKGFKIICNADVCITHTLGYSYKKILSKKIAIHNPIRHYFIIRNNIYLATRYKPLYFKIRLAFMIKSLNFLFGYPILAKPHFYNMKYVFKGFWHGIIGKLGKLDAAD